MDAQDPDAAAGEDAVATLTVPEVAERLARGVRTLFPEAFWLVGEISGLKRHRSGHWYLSLVDDQAGNDARRPSLSAKMWKPVVNALFGPRGRLTGVLDPSDGIVMRTLVEIDYYAPRGEVSFTIRDVDPDFTLGNLDRLRREVLARLEAQGALARNKARPLTPVPLTIGLITSDDSAAYNDFMRTLETSGLGLSVLFCDARMQGAETSRSVRGALATLGRMAPDCIALVRGGGSRLDLSWFDKEDVARAVADCPVPVLTGIGHEIDTSVADAAAHLTFKTPTALAEFLVGRASDAADAVEGAAERVILLARENIEATRRGLFDAAGRVRDAVSGRLADTAEELAGVRERVRSSAERIVLEQGHRLAADATRLAVGAHVTALERSGDALEAAAARVARRLPEILQRVDEGLSQREQRLRLLDPRAVLARGFAWLRRPDGSLLKDAADAVDGESLVAVLRDGELDLRNAGRHESSGDGSGDGNGDGNGDDSGETNAGGDEGQAGRVFAGVLLGPLLVLLAMTAGLLAFGCGADPDGARVTVPRPDADPSLVVIMLDTLRADHTSLHGYHRDTTPFLKELAETSVVFGRAYAPSSWTRATVASLFTGRLPEAHGCEGRDGRLAESLVTMAEALSTNGYRTHGLTANGNVLGDYGFAQGFDSYAFIKDFPAHPYADAAKMTGEVERLLAELGDGLADRPTFLYLHLVDPHDPYFPHDEFDYAPAYEGRMDGSREALEPYQYRRPAPPERQRAIDLYDGEIAYLDHHLRSVFDHLERAGLLESAWVAVMSDHGEGLWSHSVQGHGQEVYEEQLRVPLLLRPPGGLPRPARIDEPVSLLDMTATLFDLLGLPHPETNQGYSWAPFLWAEGEAPVRPIVIDEQLDSADLQAVVDAGDKLIVDHRRGRRLLFDLVANPAEDPRLATDVGKQFSMTGRRLQEILDEAMMAAGRSRPSDNQGSIEDDPELLEIFRQMGYIDAPAPPDGAGDTGGATHGGQEEGDG